MISVEAWDAAATTPFAALPDALSDAEFDGPPALVKGGQPTGVVILIEADQYSGN